MKCSPSLETTEAMRGEMVETLERSSAGEEASEAGESTHHLAFFLLMEGVKATLNCYLWTCTKAVPKIQVKASWAHT